MNTRGIDNPGTTMKYNSLSNSHSPSSLSDSVQSGTAKHQVLCYLLVQASLFSAYQFSWYSVFTSHHSHQVPEPRPGFTRELCISAKVQEHFALALSPNIAMAGQSKEASIPPWGLAVAGATGAVIANALVYPLDM